MSNADTLRMGSLRVGSGPVCVTSDAERFMRCASGRRLRLPLSLHGTGREQPARRVVLQDLQVDMVVRGSKRKRVDQLPLIVGGTIGMSREILPRGRSRRRALIAPHDPDHSVECDDRGQVVGKSTTGFWREHAFLWDETGMRDLGTLGHEASEAVRINENGVIAGTVRNYVSTILAKTGLRDRTQAALYAVRTGLNSGSTIARQTE